MKKILINTFMILSLMLSGISHSLAQSSHQQQSAVNPANTIWQGTRDGKPGEGSLFYRMEFNADYTVQILKQSGGFNESELLSWNQSGDIITIQSQAGSQITDFDGAMLHVVDDGELRFILGEEGFNIHKWHKFSAYGHALFVLLGLMLLNELCRKYRKLNYLLWFVLPVVLIPLWSSYGVTYWFKWVKLYSVVGAAALFTLVRFTRIGDMKWARFGAAAFLALNISEAVLQDFSMGNTANVLNAIGGILSIITLSGWARIHADSSKEKDMIWPEMTTFWIIAYDVWNIVFVYLNFPGSAANQAMVLIAATLPSLFIKKGTWLQARAFTLAGAFMYYFTCPFMNEGNVVPLPRNDELMLLAGLASFLINGAYAWVFFSKKFKQRQAKKAAA
ncbi:DUF5692 family protein [Vibrio sp. JC009]|uniref:DUF5692 family protein n=1 Tax=Vibrio sp. JC009 TaxID=2912314 RepID=UPI0023AE8D9E|nr:DUF5692 family protein [Vibrio sp. JC009]WED23794.1 DUF5692 family protein [Vibrio sp. JC009]